MKTDEVGLNFDRFEFDMLF